MCSCSSEVVVRRFHCNYVPDPSIPAIPAIHHIIIHACHYAWMDCVHWHACAQYIVLENINSSQNLIIMMHVMYVYIGIVITPVKIDIELVGKN